MKKTVVDIIIPHASNTNSGVQINHNVSKPVGSAMEPKIVLMGVMNQILVNSSPVPVETSDAKIRDVFLRKCVVMPSMIVETIPMKKIVENTDVLQKCGLVQTPATVFQK